MPHYNPYDVIFAEYLVYLIIRGYYHTSIPISNQYNFKIQNKYKNLKSVYSKACAKYDELNLKDYYLLLILSIKTKKQNDAYLDASLI